MSGLVILPTTFTESWELESVCFRAKVMSAMGRKRTWKEDGACFRSSPASKRNHNQVLLLSSENDAMGAQRYSCHAVTGRNLVH